MDVKLKKNARYHGHEHQKGDVVHVTEPRIANRWIEQGLASPVPRSTPKRETASVEPGETTDRPKRRKSSKRVVQEED